MKKFALLSVACLSLIAVGCNANIKEKGPTNAKDVKAADPADIQKQMEQSLKHLPEGVAPEGDASKLSTDAAQGGKKGEKGE